MIELKVYFRQEAEEKVMVFLELYVHTFMFIVLSSISMFTEIRSAGKEIFNNENHSNSKEEHYRGEMIMLLLITAAIVISLVFFATGAVKRNSTVAVWFCAVAGIVYVYIAVKQIMKMLFVPEKREFSNSDIEAFVNTYVGWWIIVLVVSAIKAEGSIAEKIALTFREEIMTGIFFMWCYFNILFAVGGLYIFLSYLEKFIKNAIVKFNFKVEDIEIIVNRICDLRYQGEKLDKLRSYRLWKENSGKGVKYKAVMTIPLFIFDVLYIIILFSKYLLVVMLRSAARIIYEPINALFKCTKNLWNKYENNEWMYLLAQMAGVCSCVIVFLKLQYGEYEESTKRVYEFLGIVTLLPYFGKKIARMNKNF